MLIVPITVEIKNAMDSLNISEQGLVGGSDIVTGKVENRLSIFDHRLLSNYMDVVLMVPDSSYKEIELDKEFIDRVTKDIRINISDDKEHAYVYLEDEYISNVLIQYDSEDFYSDELKTLVFCIYREIIDNCKTKEMESIINNSVNMFSDIFS